VGTSAMTKKSQPVRGPRTRRAQSTRPAVRAQTTSVPASTAGSARVNTEGGWYTLERFAGQTIFPR
jgi:hypothetical protein